MKKDWIDATVLTLQEIGTLILACICLIVIVPAFVYLICKYAVFFLLVLLLALIFIIFWQQTENYQPYFNDKKRLPPFNPPFNLPLKNNKKVWEPRPVYNKPPAAIISEVKVEHIDDNEL